VKLAVLCSGSIVQSAARADAAWRIPIIAIAESSFIPSPPRVRIVVAWFCLEFEPSVK
jgi:hypothetical protein